jgi:ATP-dependent DNA helicase RecQ
VAQPSAAPASYPPCATCGEPLPPSAPWCDACGALPDEVPAADAAPVPRVAPGASLPESLEAYRARLQETFGYPDFRGGQARVLEGLATHDVVGVMPTGAGKSICYVLPALEVGRTVVVSPLIALMQDQVEGLQSAGVPATFINSNLDRDEANRRYVAFIQGHVPLLYVAPERFQNQRFTAGLRQAGVNLLAIDEAHCISEWGHNFRPDYLQLGAVRERLGFPRTLALTATANPQVRRDIAARLGLAGAVEVVTTVDRPNLTLAVEHIDGAGARVNWLVQYARGRAGLSGIVYARTRRTVEEVASALVSAGVRAEAYHAGLPRDLRTAVQRRFTVGETPVIVATNAFGMGIDKPDVRYVVHLNMPGRLEAYTQEAGRAGRDGEPSECTLLYARNDRRFQQRFIDEAHPSDADVRATWQRWVRMADPQTGRLPFAVADDDPGFGMTVSALRQSRLLDPIALRVTSDREDAPIDTSGIARHREYAEARLREMAEYAETNACRRAVILRYFGEEAAERCDRCDNCLGRHESTERETFPEDLYDRILDLRDAIARQSDRDPFRVFENRTAREVATYRPRTVDALQAIWGIGERRASWFGRDLIALVESWEREHPEAAPPPAMPAAQPALSSTASRRPDDGPEVSPSHPLFQHLRAWRSERAREEGVPAYNVFSDRTLRELVTVRPRNVHALLRIWGLGESRVDRFGPELVRVIREFEASESAAAE